MSPIVATESARRYLESGVLKKIFFFLGDHVGQNLLDLNLRRRRIVLACSTAADRNDSIVG